MSFAPAPGPRGKSFAVSGDRLADEIAVHVVEQLGDMGVAVFLVAAPSPSGRSLRSACRPCRVLPGGTGRAVRASSINSLRLRPSRGVTAGENLVQRCAEQIHIGAFVRFGRRPSAISGGMYNGLPDARCRLRVCDMEPEVGLHERTAVPSVGRCRPRNFCQAPVEQNDLAVLAEHDVVGLDVAMQHAAAVGVGDGLTDADEHCEQMRRSCNSASWPGVEAGGVIVGDRLLEALAPDKLHHVERLARFVLPHVVNGDDAGMLELPGDLRFGHEALAGRTAAWRRSRFIATSRPMRGSSDTQTSPMPPRA